MQDAKTGGNRWVPDIREDEITEFQEQNGDETATYKAVNVHPIISRILDKLAFFRTHVSAVWYNKLANKTVKDKLDEIDTSISSLNSKCSYIRASGQVPAIQHQNVDIASINLKANHTYLVFGETDTTVSVNMMSASITSRSGTVNRHGISATRTIGESGGGCTIWMLAQCETDCTLALVGYGYDSSSTAYNYRGGHIIAIQLD